MDKVANRAFRRAVDLFKGRRITGKVTNNDVADLSKPMWERRGFDSQEDMMNAWRASKIAKGISSFASSLDGTDALKDLDYSVGGRVKTFLSNLFGKKPSVVEAPLGKRSNQNDLKLAYEHFDANPRLSGYSTYSDAVSDYIKRRISNDPALKRFNSLMRRYKTLRSSDAMSEWRGRLNGTPEGFLNYPFSVKGPDEGLDAAMPRLYDKLWAMRRRNEARPSAWPFLTEVAPAAGLAPETGNIMYLPMVATFRANNPFVTTFHAAHYPTTKSAMDAMDNVVHYLRSNGQPITAENVRNAMPQSISVPYERDLTTAKDVRVHVGDKYPDDIMQDLHAGYFNNRVDPNYESVWPLGAADYPDMLALHVEDSPKFRKVADETGLSHIFKRDAITPPQLQSSDDMFLYKGTPVPVLEDALPDFPEGAADDLTDEISTAYRDALQSHLNRGFGAPSYRAGEMPRIRKMPRTILGTLLDLPGHKKYPTGEPSWLTPSAVTAAGYGKDSAEMRLFPITADEARQLFSPRTSNKLEDLLKGVTPEERKQIADLVRHYGDFKQTEQFKDFVNKNIEQIADVMPRMKQTVPEPILRALQGDNSMLPVDMMSYMMYDKPSRDIISAILNTN